MALFAVCVCVRVCVSALVSVALFKELFLSGSIVSCGDQTKSHEPFWSGLTQCFHCENKETRRRARMR